MGARLIDISRMSERQLSEFSHHLRRKMREGYAPNYRPEPADRTVFAPLAEAIARDGLGIDEIEVNFRATKLRHFEAIRGGGLKGHMGYYLGFLFETAIQMSILKFAQENPGLMVVLRDTSGVFDDGRRFNVDSRGTATFYMPADNGRATRTIAEIDLVGEIHENGSIVPVIFEITLMNGHRKDFKSRRKTELLEELYGRRPYFCVVRPAYNSEEPGSSIHFSPERGVWRDLLIPRNDAIRALASRLLSEEHSAKAAEVAETAMGA